MTVSSPVYPLAWTTPDKVRTFLADMAPQNVGKRLAELRKKRGLSQEALADQLGVRARTISRWETGATGGLYDDEILEQLGRILEVPPDDIAGPRPRGSASPDEVAQLREQLDRIEQRQADVAAALDAISAQIEATDEAGESRYAALLRALGQRGRRAG